jgi:Ca-activated chloride channel family protein
MYEFHHPIWLVLLALLPLIFWRRMGRNRAPIRWSSLLVVRGGTSWRTLAAPLLPLIELFGLALLVVALARPQLTHRETVVESDGIDIILALDTSGSMDALDFTIGIREASRLDVALRVMAEFVEARPHDRLGLVVFGEEAFTQVPLTLDHKTLLKFLELVQIGVAGPNKTAIGEALAIAAVRLEQLDAPTKIVVLLTDGRSNAGRLSPLQAAQAAEALGIRVYTIGVGAMGGSGGGLFSVFRRGDHVDEETLQQIAAQTGGQYFRATDTRSLRKIYETIDQLETSTAEVTEYVHRQELYRLALIPGLALIALNLLLGWTVLRRLP